MTCPHCGCELPKGARFCSGCGAALRTDDRTSLAEELFFSLSELPFVPDPVPPTPLYIPDLRSPTAPGGAAPMPAPPVPPADLSVPAGAITEGRLLTFSSFAPPAASPPAAPNPVSAPVRESPRYSSPQPANSPAPEPAADAPTEGRKRASRKTSSGKPRLAVAAAVLLILLARNFAALREDHTPPAATPFPAYTVPPAVESMIATFPQLTVPPAVPTQSPGDVFSSVTAALDQALNDVSAPVPFAEAAGRVGARAYLDLIALSPPILQYMGKSFYIGETESSYYLVALRPTQVLDLARQRSYWDREEDAEDPAVYRLNGQVTIIDAALQKSITSLLFVSDAPFDTFFGLTYLDAAGS